MQKLYSSHFVSDGILQKSPVSDRFWEILNSGEFVVLRAFLIKIAAIFGTVFVCFTSAVFAQVATPTFIPNGGWYPTEQAVTVNCTTSGATINYTTNGVTPGPSDRVVPSGGTVLVDRPLTLEANAWKTGMTSSGTAIANFTISGKLAAGGSHSVALKSEGTVWTWGSNASGQLGIGSTDSSTHAAPVQVKLNSTTFLTGMSIAGAGASHSLAVRKSDGSVFGWGSDSAGQLGDNSKTTKAYPVQAKTTASGNPVLTGIIDIAGGSTHTLALKADGTVWTWGSNSSGQLGDGSTTSRRLAAQAKTASNTFLTGVIAIAAGDNFCAALRSDGTVWTWGVNSSGQLGIGSTTTQKYAVQVKLSGGTPLSGIADIACGSAHALALKTDGTVWSWGGNTNGQLGNGTTTQAKNPIQVKINSTTFFSGAAALAAGTSHSVILKSDGSVYACGLNSSGQLSINSTSQQLYPTQAVSSAGPVLSGIVDLGCGANHTLVTKSDGTISGSGLNSSGQAGYPTTIFNPKAATPISGFLIISALDDPDGDGLPTWRERELGTNPNNADTDGDGMPDRWEVNHNLNPLVNDASADPDGDGFTNLQEYQNGTDPFDYFNGASFNLSILSGDGQSGPPGGWLPLPLTVHVTNTSGVPLINAPVTFSLGPNSGGGVSATSGGTTVSSLTLRTDVNGNAAAYYQQPPTANTLSTVNARAGTVTIRQVTFTASTSDLPPLGLKLWLRADAGITKDGNNNISSWLDQSGHGFPASQTNSSNKPVWVSSVAGGLPAVYFDGNNRFFSLPDVMSTATAGELFVVLRTEGDPNPPRGFMRFGSQTAGDILYPYQGQIYDAFGSTTVKLEGTPPVPLTQYHLYNASSKAGEWTARINQQLQYTTSTNMAGFTTTPTIGAYYYSFYGYMSEIVIYDHVLTSADRSAVSNYLASKYQAAITPPAPTNSVGSPTTPTQVGLNWNSQTGSSIKIERKTGINGTYSQIGSTAVSATIYNDSNLSPATQYYYRIRASNFAGDSDYSNEISVTTPATGATVPTTGLKLWLRADFGVVKDANNLVSTWTDESANLNNATQATTSSQPTLVSNAMNAKPVLRFDGQTKLLGLPNFLSSATAAEGFVVTRVPSETSANGGGVWSFGWNVPAGCGHGNRYPDDQGQILDDFSSANNYYSGPTGARLDEPHVYNVVSSSAEWTSRINGNLQFTTTNNTVAFSPGPAIGAGGWQPFYDRNYFAGDIAEVLVFDHALTQTERGAVFSYLHDKYGLGDSDGDGLPDWKEREIGTDPYNPDTNGDGIPDGIEYAMGLDPTNMDMDGDGLTNAQELAMGTNPFLADTDGDGVPDNQDAFPLDPTRWQAPASDPNDYTPPTITLVEPADAVLLP